MGLDIIQPPSGVGILLSLNSDNVVQSHFASRHEFCDVTTQGFEVVFHSFSSVFVLFGYIDVIDKVSQLYHRVPQIQSLLLKFASSQSKPLFKFLL